jgi:hypothetical protein
VANNYRKAVLEQFQDLGLALLILAKEGVFAFAVFAVGHGLAWCFARLSGTEDRVADLLKNISDVGAVFLFIVLVSKDLFGYIKKK